MNQESDWKASEGYLSAFIFDAKGNAVAEVQRGRETAKVEQAARDLRHENEVLLDMIDKAEAERDALRAEVERLREALTKVANGAKYLIEDADLLDRTKTIRAIVKIARAVLDAGQDQ